MKRMVVAVLVLALAGCAPMRFTKAGAADEEFRRDSYECRQQVLTIPGVATNPLIAADMGRKLITECMTARGWTRH